MNSVQTQRHKAVIRVASDHASAIQKAIAQSIDVDKLMKSWDESKPVMTGHDIVATNQHARDWLKFHVYPDLNPLNKVLHHLYADGWALGSDIAHQSVLYMKVKKSFGTMDLYKAVQAIDWANWKAGNKAAADLLNPSSGLKDLMSSRMVTIRGISDTSLNRIGTVLGNALAQGRTGKSVANEVDQIINDPLRAQAIAETEMTRAVSVSARDSYTDMGVEYVEWLVADGCDICQENEEASPIPIDATFPSGDSEPPAHPNCMCSLAPYVVDTQNIGEQNLDDSFTPVDDGASAPIPTADLLGSGIATAPVVPPVAPISNTTDTLKPLEDALAQAKAGYRSAMYALEIGSKDPSTPLDELSLLRARYSAHLDRLSTAKDDLKAEKLRLETERASNAVVDASKLEPMPYAWSPVEKYLVGYLDDQQYKEIAQAINIASHAPTTIRTSTKALKSIIDDGRFKTVSEVKDNFGGSRTIPDNYRAMRSTLENDKWKIPAQDVQPIYGYQDTGVGGHQPSVGFYGEVKVVLKESVAGRTTMTAGDSLNSNFTPIKLIDARAGTLTNSQVSSASDAIHNGKFNPRLIDYYEAQIHGGVSLSDIESIDLNGEKFPKAYIDKLEKLGIEVTK